MQRSEGTKERGGNTWSNRDSASPWRAGRIYRRSIDPVAYKVGPGAPPFCQVGDPTKLVAWVIIDQADIDLVKQGQAVDLKLYSHAIKTFDGTIDEIPNVDVERLPMELSSGAGGEVPTKEDPKTHQQKPIHTQYYAVVPVANPDGVFQPGLRGKAKIKADKLTLGMRVWRWAKRTFHFET